MYFIFCCEQSIRWASSKQDSAPLNLKSVLKADSLLYSHLSDLGRRAYKLVEM